MSGGGSKTTTESEQETRLSEELRASSVTGLEGAENLYNAGTEGIYQGTRLADEDPLISQAQEGLLDLYSPTGGLTDLINTQQTNLNNMLMSGDLENNSIFQQQMADILEESGVQFKRQAVPLFQRGTAIGQYGGSEGMEGLGLLGGEIDRNTKQSITRAALEQQQLALQAQGLLPMALQVGERGFDVMGQIAGQRGTRSQQELMDEIGMFNAPRDATLKNLSDFYAFLGANPLGKESNMTGTETQTTKNSSDPFGAILGAGLAVAGMPVAGVDGASGGSLGGNFIQGLFS
tara:strand:+ start:1560 stop:2432 length:873 start_codon:yes stop_codon:yes gene_type:complete